MGQEKHRGDARFLCFKRDHFKPDFNKAKHCEFEKKIYVSPIDSKETINKYMDELKAANKRRGYNNNATEAQHLQIAEVAHDDVDARE